MSPPKDEVSHCAAGTVGCRGVVMHGVCDKCGQDYRQPARTMSHEEFEKFISRLVQAFGGSTIEVNNRFFEWACKEPEEVGTIIGQQIKKEFTTP